jgi:DNA-binding NtrC family response regulator
MASILIIDDDSAFCRSLCEQFQESGHDAYGATGGHEALKIVDSRTVDLVITDIVMEFGEGIETIRTLQERAPLLPIIAMSGNPDYLHYTEQLGASRVIEKPFPMSKILEAVNELLGPPPAPES